jgi:hypothetical protein
MMESSGSTFGHFFLNANAEMEKKMGTSGFALGHSYLNAIAEMARREGFEPPTLRFEGESEPQEPPTLTLQ